MSVLIFVFSFIQIYLIVTLLPQSTQAKYLDQFTSLENKYLNKFYLHCIVGFLLYMHFIVLYMYVEAFIIKMKSQFFFLHLLINVVFYFIHYLIFEWLILNREV